MGRMEDRERETEAEIDYQCDWLCEKYPKKEDSSLKLEGNGWYSSGNGNSSSHVLCLYEEEKVNLC